MIYKKICPICHKLFHAMKISTTFCSKKCSNRTRYLPSRLVAALRKKVAPYNLTTNDYAASILELEKVPELIAREQEDLAIAARNLKRQRDQEEEYKKKESLESESGFSIASEPIKIVSDEFGNDLKIQGIEKKYKIRRIGGGG